MIRCYHETRIELVATWAAEQYAAFGTAEHLELEQLCDAALAGDADAEEQVLRAIAADEPAGLSDAVNHGPHRSRTATVRDLEAATWRPESLPAGYVSDLHPARSQADIAEGRAVTMQLPVIAA